MIAAYGGGVWFLILPYKLCYTEDNILQPPQDDSEKNRKFSYVELNSEKYIWIVQPNGKKYSAAGMLESLLSSATSKTFLHLRFISLCNISFKTNLPFKTLSPNEVK